ncbi:MAG: response regulator, partial [Desulfobacterales bacterium]|nr:response regulator [Desulfobacterales bacterium]
GRRPEESEESEEFDSLELDRYSEFNLLIRGLNESVVDVGAINAQLDIFYSHFDGYITRQRVLINELQEKMMRMRMSPMAILSNRMYRTVREVAARLDKKVRLIVRGEDIELDREIWEKLTGPLMHLLRNAVDHGIELQSLRQALEKPEIGTVSVSASREGNRVIIRVEDDGGGLNYRAIKKAASQSGLANPSDKLSMEALAAMIFSPGFTTRGDVSEISGRGVGLDVVQENIRKLKGTVAVSSVSSGKGTRFTITIPLTLAVVRGLLFTANEKKFAAALSEISEILRVDPSNLISDPEPGVKLGDELLPLFRLSDLLRLPPAEDGAAVDPSSPLILVIEHRGRRKALAIDALLGQREIVIKSLGSHLRHVKGISGVTIMGDGSLIPILNLDEVFIDAAGRPESGEAIPEAPVPEKPPEIMVVDDSVSIRHVVSRLLMDQGWRVNTAKDGQEALEKMGEKRPDLIVLDIEMPRMNGFEFLSARKNQEAYQEIPVIILTSRPGAKHRQKAKRLGSDGYIIKPYDDAHFVNLIQTLLERRI